MKIAILKIYGKKSKNNLQIELGNEVRKIANSEKYKKVPLVFIRGVNFAFGAEDMPKNYPKKRSNLKIVNKPSRANVIIESIDKLTMVNNNFDLILKTREELEK